VERGELMAIVGVSGSGKSTLLNILGGLDRPSAGRVMVDGKDLLKASDRALDEYRRTQVGFVWQQTARNLIPYLTAQANVELPMTIEGVGPAEKRAWSRELLQTVGLWEHRKHSLVQLSGGQQQRVAIAVALANRPQLLLADEPTGEVDSKTARDILDLFQRMNEHYGLTTIIVTHDPQTARMVDRVVTIRDGRISNETVRRVADVEAALVQGIEDAAASVPMYDEYVVVDEVGRLQIPPDLRIEMNIGRRVTLEKTERGVLICPVDGLAPTVVEEEQEAANLDDQPPAARRTALRRWFKKEK
jgi:ABC-type lipoprotein export system ATPase subunit/bifunctional DNA-binding transcriptional regulator/antitoxin component of YhaV-PrlF toxin-antitoxin module